MTDRPNMLFSNSDTNIPKREASLLILFKFELPKCSTTGRCNTFPEKPASKLRNS